MTKYTKFSLLFALIAATLSAQQPVAPGQITGVSGNGRTLVTTTGAQTSGNLVKIDANGNHVDSGSTSSGGNGTVTTISAPASLFSIANPTTTPALSYATGQTANRIFGTDASGNAGLFSLTGAMLPNPSASTLGGVQSVAAVTHNFLISISTSGVPAKAQPAIADLSDGTTLATLNASANTQTGTSYTLLSSDNGKIVTLNNASAITLTVPSGLGAGFNCLIVQLGAGAVTPTASSTTLHNRQSFTKTAGQYAVATLAAYVADTFVLGGDLQ